jgi:hypothetical protein
MSRGNVARMDTPGMAPISTDTTRTRTGYGLRISAALASFIVAVFATRSFAADPQPPSLATQPQPAAESPAAAAERHARVAERRKGVEIIAHRGSLEFAHENTLEAYRATFELGADGNEIDIRATRDGVLVCFHDDMLDHLLEAFGTVREVDWQTLQSFRFRDPGRFGDQCRIPTLVEVFELHRRHSGLIHLDIKEPGLDEVIVGLLDAMDMWDHIAQAGGPNAAAIVKGPRLKLSRYKGGLYEDRGEIDPGRIAVVLGQAGNSVILEDPRATLAALGRMIGRPSSEPVRKIKPVTSPLDLKPTRNLLGALRNDDGWNQVAQSEPERELSAIRIRRRAEAADLLQYDRSPDEAVFAALEDRIRHRSLHKEWMYHGFDGAIALRTLIRHKAPNVVDVAREVLWRDDPALKDVYNSEYKTPVSWTDFRLKMWVFPSLATLPGAATEQLCRDYLALDDEAARQIGPPQFEEAARTLLTVSPTTETAAELMKHRLSAVRGRASLMCMARGEEEWARQALEEHAPFAIPLIVQAD